MNDLQRIAIDYVGTPHHNGGNVKGAGLDCCTLMTNIQKDMGYGDVPISFGYSQDWFCQKNCKELLLPYLQEYCTRVKKLKEGDIISYRWGRAKYAHLAMYIGNNLVIHCNADHGVNIAEFNDSCFYDAKGESRITGYWRRRKE